MSAILYIEGKNNPNANKILHYADGTVEVRTPDWKQVLEVYNINREATMLDIEDQFLKIYDDSTPKDRAKKLRQMAKALAKEAGDIVQIAAIEAEEKEAAEKAAKDAKAAKARKRKASEKRSATLFKDETEQTGKENSENETLSSSSADLEESIGSRTSAGCYKEEEEVETSISFEADSISSDEDEEVEAYESTDDDEVSDSSDADSDNLDEDVINASSDVDSDNFDEDEIRDSSDTDSDNFDEDEISDSSDVDSDNSDDDEELSA